MEVLTLFVLLLFEILGSLMIMDLLGLENPERIVIGVAFACLVFYITWQAGQIGHQRESDSGRFRRSLWSLLSLTIYTAVVISVGILRMEQVSGEEDGSSLLDWSSTTIMLATAIGPAWLAEMVMRKLAPATILRKEIRQLRKRSALYNRRISRAQTRIDKISERQLAWDAKAARLRSAYAIAQGTVRKTPQLRQVSRTDGFEPELLNRDISDQEA